MQHIKRTAIFPLETLSLKRFHTLPNAKSGNDAHNIFFALQNGHTPLMRASLGGNAECAKLLLDRGAQINLQDKVSECLRWDQAIV